MPTMTESDIRRIVAETIASLQQPAPPRHVSHQPISRRSHDRPGSGYGHDQDGIVTVDSDSETSSSDSACSSSSSCCCCCCCSSSDDEDGSSCGADDDACCGYERGRRRRFGKMPATGGRRDRGIFECSPALRRGDWGGRVEGVVRYPGEVSFAFLLLSRMLSLG